MRAKDLAMTDAQPEVARRDRGVLARGALAVVVAGDDDVPAVVGLLSPLGVGVVDPGEAELASFGMLDRSGSACAPAGEISSVETLSPTLSSTGASSSSGSGDEFGQARDVGPLHGLDTLRLLGVAAEAPALRC